MNPRIAKDIRLMAPASGLTVVLMIAASFLPQVGQGWAVTVFVFGCLIVAGSIFGAEFACGTVPQLLAQPMDRRRIWREKTLVMAAALALLFAVLVVTEHVTWPAVFAIAAFCAVPYFTLVGRSTISGIILSIPIPGALFLTGGLLALWLLRPSGGSINEERLHFWVRAYMYTVLPAYCGVVFCLGYRRFVNFEVAGGEPAQVRLPASMLARLESLAEALIPHRHLRSLVAKELHLQHNSTILFLVFTAIQLLILAFIKLGGPGDPEIYFFLPVFFYAAIMPLLIGSSAIAEETNLGTRAWALSLPVSVRTQWLIKLVVVIVFTVALAIAVTLFWLATGLALGLPTFSTNWVLFCAPALPVAFVAFYASSFSRDTLRALLTTIGLCAAVVFITASAATAFERDLLGIPQHLIPELSWEEQGHFAIFAIVWIVFGLPFGYLLFLLLRGSFKCFSTLERRPLWRTLVSVVLPPILVLTLLMALLRILL
ncbi:MAG TPA: hypothetical protein VJ063_04410 [Verrucomicrobiae bacterium]|nr:hypothetical protein [Verrucomicrobiae bacterium]